MSSLRVVKQWAKFGCLVGKVEAFLTCDEHQSVICPVDNLWCPDQVWIHSYDLERGFFGPRGAPVGGDNKTRDGLGVVPLLGDACGAEVLQALEFHAGWDKNSW